MTVKSIIDVEVNDAAFQRFSALWEKYQKALEKTPAMWAAATGEVTEQGRGFAAIAAALLAQTELLHRASTEQRAVANEVERASRSWREMARSTKSVADNVASTTLSLLKWTGITAVISGLFGGAGVLGFDRLAATVSGTRQQALGLGTSYGGLQSFEANFARLVNPQSLLSGVSEALAGNRTPLFQVGLNQGQMTGDTEQTSINVLQSVKRLVDATPETSLAWLGLSRPGLSQLGFGTEQLRLLKHTSYEELSGLISRERKGRTDYDVPPDAQRAYQDLTTELGRAGKSIENTFVTGLSPLIPDLKQLTESFGDTVRAFLNAPILKTAIDDLTSGFSILAGYIKNLSSGQADPKIPAMITGALLGARVAGIPGAVVGAVIGAGLAPSASPDTDIGKQRQDISARADRLRQLRAEGKATVWSQFTDLFSPPPINNPGNLRPPGGTGFQQFSSPEAGVLALAHQLQLYGNRDKLDTIGGIIPKYAPSSENDTAAYVRDVSARTGFAPGQHLNLNDRDTLARLIAAITAHEQHRGNYDRYKDAKVVVQVLNNTGGNAIITTNALKN